MSVSNQLHDLKALLLQEKFLVIGHRGASGLEPENTLPSFAKALQLGCAMIELDVHQIKPAPDLTMAIVAVIHDDKLNRTTNSKGPVKNLTLAELSGIDAGNGNPIPQLEDVIQLVKGAGGAWINVELKGEQTAIPVCRCLKSQAFTRALVSSFDHSQLFAFRQHDSTTPVAPLFHRWQKNAIDIAHELGAFSINLSLKLATPERIDAIRQEGFEVFVYTVNDPDVAVRLYADGVSGVFTDYPNRVTVDRVVNDVL
ncbi:MAG: glycerophosphodiester phosphodiesterase family protein [Pseudomonadota bacterium]